MRTISYKQIVVRIVWLKTLTFTVHNQVLVEVLLELIEPCWKQQNKHAGRLTRENSYKTSLSHYSDVIKSPASRLFAQPFVQAGQRKHQSSASLAFVRVIYRRPMHFPHKGPITQKMFPFDNVIMYFNNWIFVFKTSFYWLILFTGHKIYIFASCSPVAMDIWSTLWILMT